MSGSSKFERESALLTYLATALSMPIAEVFDPKCRYGRETGIDVVFSFQGDTIGVQVTEYDGGEGVANVDKGTLRKQEAMARRGQIPIGMFVGNQPLTSIKARISEKIRKAENYSFEEFDQVWLLMLSNIPDAVGTLVPKGLVTTEGLSAILGDALLSSKYDRVFYQQIMYPTLCEWSRESGWISCP
jgi:hypothetical protein